MTTTPDAEKALQQEAERARYALRSSYYYRMDGLWDGLLEMLNGVAEPDWAGRAGWGISETAWARAQQTGAAPVSVFCHPEVITAEPRLIAYYRHLAVIPQKGMQTLGVNTANLEQGRGRLNATRPSASPPPSTTLSALRSNLTRIGIWRSPERPPY